MTKSELPDEGGYLVLPRKVGWGILWTGITSGLALVVSILTMYAALNGRVEAVVREVQTIQGQRANNLAEFKAKDAALEARVETLREIINSQQGAILTRLSRIETILERVERRPDPRP